MHVAKFGMLLCVGVLLPFLMGCDACRLDPNVMNCINSCCAKKELKIISQNQHVCEVKFADSFDQDSFTNRCRAYGFTDWHEQESSEGFVVRFGEEVVFEGAPHVPLRYSVNRRSGKYAQAILIFDDSKIIIYTLASDFGG